MGFLDLLLDFVYPPRPKCGLCSRPLGGRTGDEICPVCREELTTWHGQLFPCGCCGRLGAETGLCQDCREAPPVFVLARAVGPYRGVLKDAVQRLKYGGGRHLARPLGRLMAVVVLAEADFGCIDLVAPVPLSGDRLQERGYNQSALLAAELAGTLGKPVSPQLLAKTRATPSQTRLTRGDRLRNPAGAFAVNRAVAVRDRRVLLVDDILTTGATVGECARMLITAGAAGVTIITAATALARPVLPVLEAVEDISG